MFAPEAREKKFIENWHKRKEKKKSKNQQAEAKAKTERKDNLKRKEDDWKQQVQNSKRQKVNPPIFVAYEEDDEKQPEMTQEENQNSSAEEVDNPLEIENQLVENNDHDDDDMSEFEDIFAPRRKEDNKESQDVDFDNSAEFLDRFDDDELENLL